MMKHLFLTGNKQVGKSTLLRKWLSHIDARKSGFYTRKYKSDDGHLYVHMLAADREDDPRQDNILFDCRTRDLTAASERFNHLGCDLLRPAEDTQLIIMDEIGVMEEKADLFCEAVLRALDGATPVIGVLRKETLDPPLIHSIKNHPDVQIIEVTKENRDELALSLPDILLPYSHHS